MILLVVDTQKGLTRGCMHAKIIIKKICKHQKKGNSTI